MRFHKDVHQLSLSLRLYLGHFGSICMDLTPDSAYDLGIKLLLVASRISALG